MEVYIKRFKICRDVDGQIVEAPKNYYYLNGERIQLCPRPPHATVSIIIHKNDFAKMDEYLADCFSDYTVIYFKPKLLSFAERWQEVYDNLNLQFHKTKKSVYYECISFGGNSEFWEDMSDDQKLKYFKWCYDFAVRYIGYNGTDGNIMFAYILNRENRHYMEVFYLPVVSHYRKKVYSHERSPSGGYLQAKDDNGSFIYKTENTEYPLLSHYQFWNERGGEIAYSALQEDFYQQVSELYHVTRGDSISPTKSHALHNSGVISATKTIFTTGSIRFMKNKKTLFRTLTF